MKNSFFILFFFLTLFNLNAENCTLECPSNRNGTCNISEISSYTSYNEFLSDGGSVSGSCTIVAESFQLVALYSDNGSCPETFTRVYEISDDNSVTYQCSQEIFINDNIDPLINCPFDDAIECDISIAPAFNTFNEFVSGGGSAYDNCAINENSFYYIEFSSNTSCPEIVTREYVISDLCGNYAICQQNITINDYTNPYITCPPNEFYPAPAQPPYVDLSDFISKGGSAQDNCDIDASSFVLTAEMTDDNENPTYIIRTYRIRDNCYNDDECTQTITYCNNTTATLLISECESYNSPSGKYTWTESDIYLDTILNETLCDSLLTIYLTIEDNVVEEGMDGMPNSLRMSLACAENINEIVIAHSVDTIRILDPLIIENSVSIIGDVNDLPVLEFDFMNAGLLNASFGMKIETGNAVILENLILTDKNNPNKVDILLNEGSLEFKKVVKLENE